MDTLISSDHLVEVVCFCVQWCGSCRTYQPVFEGVATEFEGLAWLRWIDIEDESEVLGDVDVDNFPTLLISRQNDVLFFGPLDPHAATLRQLVHSAVENRLPVVHDAEPCELVRRIAGMTKR